MTHIIVDMNNTKDKINRMDKAENKLSELEDQTKKVARKAVLEVCVCVERERKRKIWLTQLWGLASPKSSEQAGRPETQGRVHIVVQV